MRRSTAIMAQLRAQREEGTSLAFEDCTGGHFSSCPEYALHVMGRYEPPAQENLFSLEDDFTNCSSWPGTTGDVHEVGSMLEPDKTYTISFDAKGVWVPEETVYRENCCYDPETGEPWSCGELEIYNESMELGFMLVPPDAVYGEWGLGCPMQNELPLVYLSVNHRIKEGETLHASVTFTTPSSLEGYMICALTNQYYYSHLMYPELTYSTVNFSNIKIEEGEVETPYLPYGQEGETEPRYVREGTVISVGDNDITVPCDLTEGDVWYPCDGILELAGGGYTKTESFSVVAPKGSFVITQIPTDLEAILSATLLTKRT